MIQKILLTGASGFIGRTLLKFLQRDDYDVIPLVRTPHGLENEVVVDFNDRNFPCVLRKALFQKSHFPPTFGTTATSVPEVGMGGLYCPISLSGATNGGQR